MSPVEGSLLLLALALALVGLGYWLGSAQPARRRGHSALSASGPVTRPGPHMPRPTGPAMPVAKTPADDSVQREIEAHVRALRRAPEQAEPWRPPAVDVVEASAEAVWFADTAVEPPPPTPPLPFRRR